MVDGVRKGVYPQVFGRSKQLSLNKFFDPSTPSMRKGRDGGKKRGKKKREKTDERGQHPQLLAPNRYALPGDGVPGAPLPQWDLGTILGNPMRCWKSQTPLEFSYLMRILAPARIPMGSWNSEGPQVFLGPQNSHISWNPHTLS